MKHTHTQMVAFAAAVVLAIGASAQAAINSGLIMYTPYDTDTLDQIAPPADDPIYANLVATGGKFGGFAHQSNGGMGYSTIKGAGSFGSSFTATAWIKPDLDNKIVFGNAAANQQGWAISAANNGNLYVSVNDGVSNQTGNLPFDYTNDPWIFASFTYDQGTQAATFRIENGYSGALVTHAFTLNASASLVSTTGYYWSNGSLFHDGNTNAAPWGWDDVAFWGRALTTDEIGQIFNDGDGATIESLMIPEPATLSLLAVGAIGMIARKKRK